MILAYVEGNSTVVNTIHCLKLHCLKPLSTLEIVQESCVLVHPCSYILFLQDISSLLALSGCISLEDKRELKGKESPIITGFNMLFRATARSLGTWSFADQSRGRDN